jgi:aminoglycoside phosphotransferase (APT) family kinase protein
MDDAALDPIDILTALGVCDVTAVAPVQGGWDTSIWRVESDGAVYALRVFRAEQAEVCRREVIAMRTAADGGLPVPRIHSEGSWSGRPALLLSWCSGVPLWQALKARPWRAWALGVKSGQMLAQLHTVPPPEELRRSDRDWIAWAGPEEELLQARLRALAGRPEALLHLDYHPLNVMTDGRQVTGILDWANTAVGDPRADLARTFSILRFAPAGAKTMRWLVIAVARCLELGCWYGYRRETGPLPDMPLFHAWAWAVMARDLAPKLGRPGIWLRPHHLDGIRRQAAVWKRRAGIQE